MIDCVVATHANGVAEDACPTEPEATVVVEVRQSLHVPHEMDTLGAAAINLHLFLLSVTLVLGMLGQLLPPLRL